MAKCMNEPDVIKLSFFFLLILKRARGKQRVEIVETKQLFVTSRVVKDNWRNVLLDTDSVRCECGFLFTRLSSVVGQFTEQSQGIIQSRTKKKRRRLHVKNGNSEKSAVALFFTFIFVIVNVGYVCFIFNVLLVYGNGFHRHNTAHCFAIRDKEN